MQRLTAPKKIFFEQFLELLEFVSCKGWERAENSRAPKWTTRVSSECTYLISSHYQGIVSVRRGVLRPPFVESSTAICTSSRHFSRYCALWTQTWKFCPVAFRMVSVYCVRERPLPLAPSTFPCAKMVSMLFALVTWLKYFRILLSTITDGLFYTPISWRSRCSSIFPFTKSVIAIASIISQAHQFFVHRLLVLLKSQTHRERSKRRKGLRTLFSASWWSMSRTRSFLSGPSHLWSVGPYGVFPLSYYTSRWIK